MRSYPTCVGRQTLIAWTLTSVLSVSAPCAFAQSSISQWTTLDTSGSVPLTTELRQFGPVDGSAPIVLQFTAGFGTDEPFGPGKIFDSFSITLKGDEPMNQVLATFDASGVAFTPSTLQTSGADHGSSLNFTYVTTEYPDVLKKFSSQVAYQFQIAMDPAFATKGFEVYFDLFSNQEGAESQGWFSRLTVVPEPGAAVLGVLGGLFLLSSLRRVLG